MGVVFMVQVAEDAIFPLLDACEGIWDMIIANNLFVFWVGTAVLGSGFWAMRRAKRLVR